MICLTVEVWNLLTKAQNQQERLLLWPCTMKGTGDFFFFFKAKKNIWSWLSSLLRQTSKHMILIHCENYDGSVYMVLIGGLHQIGESFKPNF